MLGKSVPCAALLPACQHKQATANRNLERFHLWIEQVNEKYFKMTINMSVLVVKNNLTISIVFF